MERVADVFGNAFRPVDLCDPLGDRPEHLAVIDLLERLAVDEVPADLADAEHHRRRILEGDVDAGAGVGRAGSAGDEGDAWTAGHLAVGVGHIGDPAFLPADDDVDFGRVVERVENGEEALAGDGEDAVAAVDPELVDEDASAGARSG